MALDFGVTFVRNRWDFGAGVGGVGNRIDVEQDHATRALALVSLLNESEWFMSSSPASAPRLDSSCRSPIPATSPITERSGPSYTEYSRGFEGNNFRTGLEYRLGGVELRGAGRISQGNWYPSGGAGFNLTRNFGVDAALFGTKTFLEPNAHLGLALSFRIDKRESRPIGGAATRRFKLNRTSRLVPLLSRQR